MGVAFGGGRVAAIGPGLSGAETLDCTGRIVAPGMIALHAHVFWGRSILGSRPRAVRLDAPSERDICAGQVIVCCASDHGIHRVSCGSGVPSVGIHVYGADIGTLPRHVYDPATAQMRTFVSSWTPLDPAPQPGA